MTLLKHALASVALRLPVFERPSAGVAAGDRHHRISAAALHRFLSPDSPRPDFYSAVRGVARATIAVGEARGAGKVVKFTLEPISPFAENVGNWENLLCDDFADDFDANELAEFLASMGVDCITPLPEAVFKTRTPVVHDPGAHRSCSRCHAVKPPTYFYRKSADPCNPLYFRFSSWCKVCAAAASSEWARAHGHRDYRTSRPERWREGTTARYSTRGPRGGSGFTFGPAGPE